VKPKYTTNIRIRVYKAIPCYHFLDTIGGNYMKHIVVNGKLNTNYFVDEEGIIYTSEKVPMKQHKMDNGYLRVKLRKEIKSGLYLVHRVVAETYIPNPEKLPVVHHKDDTRDNNHASNLEWCNNSYNQKQRFKTHKGTKRKPVAQIDLKTSEVIKVWDSPIDVTREIGVAYQNISKVCKGLRNSAGGYGWKHI
jgi:hypothetical protein